MKIEVIPFKNQKSEEFEAYFENHPLGNQNIYRLYYMNFHRIGENYEGKKDDNIGIVNWPFDAFTLPNGMSREDAFKVLSYLTDFIEKDAKLEPCSFQSVQVLNSVLDLKRLGFYKIKEKVKDEDIIDLFTITGRIALFKKDEHYPKYFEWYQENVTLQDVRDIYHKIGRDFYDLVPVTSQDNSQKTVQYTKKNK